MDVIEIAHMNLFYREKFASPRPGLLGTYLGRGDGRIEGKRISGEVVWDLYENQGPAACDTHMTGVITTGDGAGLDFDLLGFFRRDRNDEQKWNLSSAIRFRTHDERYQCFADSVALIKGQFDMQDYVHDYRLYAPACEER